MSELSPEDVRALVLAKGGVECENGTEALRRYQRLCEQGYVKEALFTPTSISWRLTGRGAKIVYIEEGE